MADVKRSTGVGSASEPLARPDSLARIEEALGDEFVWGQSAVLRDLRRRSLSAAQSAANVLLVGETGTGKGRLARWMHRLSPRRRAPFIHFDCAAVSPSLFETELFGHERGAFTGAQSRRVGSAERAKAGTLFLDEIGELGPGHQAKFLRLLEDRTFERVGGASALCLRARVLAATNRHLALSKGLAGFRRDLLHRLSVVTLRIPSLRERPEDIPALVTYAGARMEARTGHRIRVSPDGLQALTLYSWPGNVREVMNLMERAAVCWPHQELDLELVRRLLDARDLDPAPRAFFQPRGLATGLPQVVEACGGNISQAARLLGIPRSTLRYRIRSQLAGPPPGGPGRSGP